jgi:phospholipid/cholesterol/gamma-HCH transport system substrate-binding protein
VYDDLSATVASLKTVSARLEDGEGALGKLLSSDDRLYDDLAAGAAALRELVQGVNRGEGLLGRLAKDEQLFQDVERIVDEIQAAVDDFRETAPVVNFSSIFFGAF